MRPSDGASAGALPSVRVAAVVPDGAYEAGATPTDRPAPGSPTTSLRAVARPTATSPAATRSLARSETPWPAEAATDRRTTEMALRLANVVIDCDDVLTVARFWSTALRRPIDPDPSEYFASIGTRDEDRDTVRWFFAKVPEKRVAKNRVHVDLVADDKDEELARLLDLGATKLADKEEYGHAWTVLQDPEGNEFCLAATAWPEDPSSNGGG